MLTRITLPSRSWIFYGFPIFVSLIAALFATQLLMAQSQDNYLLVLELNNSRALRYNADTGQFVDVFIPANNGGIDYPQDIEVGFDGNLYISNFRIGTVSRYDRATGRWIDNFVPQGRGLTNPEELVFHSDGMLYVSDRPFGSVLRYDGRTGALLDTFVRDTALIGFTSFAFGPDGNLYAGMFLGANTCIRRYNGQTGEFISNFFCQQSSNSLSGITFAPDGSIFVTRYNDADVLHVSAQGTLIKRLQCPGDVHTDFPRIGPDGRLYVNNQETGNISVFDPQSGACLGNFLTGFAADFTKGFTFLSNPMSIYLSSTTGGTAGGVNFGDEDILRFNPSSNSWVKYFDGSDVGLSANDVDALIVKDGDLLLSLELSATLSGIAGTVQPNDLIRFHPTSLGESTRGTFSMFLDASDVSLGSVNEDIDAATFLLDGRLAVSTRVTATVPGLIASDEDWLVLNNGQFGTNTAGTWSLYFDGSDVGLGSPDEDIRGAGVNAAGELLLVTNGNFSVPNPDGTRLTGNGSDVFICKPGTLGTNTTCTFRKFFEGATHGFGTESIDSFELLNTASITVTVTSADTNDTSVDDPNADDHAEENEESNEDEEMTSQLFLPWSAR